MLGFSTIAISNYPQIQWDEVLSKFNYFDISPLHVSLIPTNQVLSMQGIFYGKDMKNASLVKSNEAYFKLKSIFTEVVEFASHNGIRSLIWGAPNTRSGIEVPREVAIERATELIHIAATLNTKLYFEALTPSLCQFLNTHLELIELHALAGIGGIHYDICTAILQNEGDLFLDAHISSVERYHLSEDGYSLAVLHNSIALAINKRLQQFQIKGTLEVQDFSNFNTAYLIDTLKILSKISKI